jgi:UrcA family protein
MIKTKLIVLAASLVAATPAFAAELTVDSREVQSADLNLSSQSGRTSLERRIRFAVNIVCNVDNSLAGRASESQRKCIQVANASTRPQVARLLAGAGAEVALLDNPAAR